MVAGIFFLSASILALELIGAQLLGFVFGSNYSLVVIGIAMLGTCFAGSCLTGQPKPLSSVQIHRRLAILALLSAATIVLLFIVSYLTRAYINLATVAASMQQQVGPAIRASRWGVPVVGLAMAIPYFVFGLILTESFRRVEASRFGMLYGMDLLGAALGGVAAYLVMNLGDYRFIIALPFALSLAGLFAFARHADLSRRQRRIVGGGSVVAALALIGIGPWIEPQPELHTLARDFNHEFKVTERHHGWTSYARVGVLDIVMPQRVHHSIALGGGEGIARLEPYDPTYSTHPPEMVRARLVASLQPKTALVLMAGAGGDMVDLDRAMLQKTEIRGVELNPQVAAAALRYPEFNLRNFFGKKNINYIVDEARSYLERDSHQYDFILFSWAGSTWAYYTGTVGHTSQWLYTTESLRTTLKHLTPQGVLMVLNSDKTLFLTMLKEVLGPEVEARRMAMLFRPPSGAALVPRVRGDSDWLLIKPAGFSDEDIKKLEPSIQEGRLQVLYSAGGGSFAQQELLSGVLASQPAIPTSWERRLATAMKGHPVEKVATDDRPFILQQVSSLRDAGRHLLSWGGRSVTNPGFNLLLSLVITLVGGLLILGPLLMRERIPANRVSFFYLFYFGLLGAGFMFLELGLINRLNLLVGDPGLTLATVLSGLILFTGAGSLHSQRNARFPLRYLVPLLIVYLIGLIATLGPILHHALAWNQPARIALALALLFPAGYLMGHLFPRGLAACARADVRLVPWAWAINGAAGTGAAALGWLLSQCFGFTLVMGLGTLFYTGLLVLALLYKSEHNPLTHY